jgi:hypothetical protein
VGTLLNPGAATTWLTRDNQCCPPRPKCAGDFTDYYDLIETPEKYTGYDGSNVWHFIRHKICFQVRSLLEPVGLFLPPFICGHLCGKKTLESQQSLACNACVKYLRRHSWTLKLSCRLWLVWGLFVQRLGKSFHVQGCQC